MKVQEFYFLFIGDSLILYMSKCITDALTGRRSCAATLLDLACFIKMHFFFFVKPTFSILMLNSEQETSEAGVHHRASSWSSPAVKKMLAAVAQKPLRCDLRALGTHPRLPL